MEIKANTIKEAWPKILSRIINFGDVVDIMVDGKKTPTLELPEPLTTIIKNPQFDMIIEGGIWTNQQALEIYSNNVIQNKDTGHDYTYGERFRDFSNFDQIEKIIFKLVRDRTSRQAVACTWKVEDDINGEHPPCLLVLDNIIRFNELLSTAYIRSNDMYGAWPENVYMLVRLNQYIAREINRLYRSNGKYIDSGKLYRFEKDIEIGRLITISNKAHVYWWDIEQACKLANMPKLSNNILQAMGINKGITTGIA